MKIVLLAVGKTDNALYTQEIDLYTGRINRYLGFAFDFVPDIKNSRHLSQQELKTREGERLLDRLQPSDRVVLLDEGAQQYSSVEFARFIEKSSHSVSKRLVFVIGGPYGFSTALHERADDKLSLSKMTFTHQMVRLLFTEQLYRALTILRGEPYHHK